ncbi:hypothetical protein Vretimale_833 [Volvox reticuliferus]|uniref:Uncharacterized protein n=1 Tax=Volvox reticuliferus TaxID=1737510 RepID=A0A8J4BYE0_9CHLO|nr:hypothetical protein Vretifemale_2241 [Volvox reticuliferus]GIL94605.1 hypothetical protein Vretimale_833 [Volvox reticuliferus]
MDFLRRRKRLLVGVAAGAAGAAAAYFWWVGYNKTKLEQKRSVEKELTAILRGAALHNGLSSSGGVGADGGGDTDGDDCGSPDLDESLDSHFNYIQKVSAPQELSNLLPRIQATLFKLTDVSLVKQLHQQLQERAQQQETGGSDNGSGDVVQQQLRLLARLCFGRTVAAAFLLPLMDLCVRTKLNIIGRHLFLQEKFSKLRQPVAPAARMRLPPRLTGGAVESFLACEQLAERGCAWLAEQAMLVADRVLEGTPMNANVTPEELANMVQAMATYLGQTVTAAGPTSPTGCVWVDTIVGPAGMQAAGGDAAATSGSAEAYRRALSNAAMVEELESELRRVLCNYRFGDALHCAVSQCLSTCAAHIHATFISQAAAQQQQQQRVTSAQQRQEQGQVLLGQQHSPSQPRSSSDALEGTPSGPSQQRVLSPFSTASQRCAETTTEGNGECVNADQRRDGQTGAEVKPPVQNAPPAPSPSLGSGGSASSGSLGRAASLAAAAVAAMQPRPLARCLRVVQSACDPLFVDAREVSARIACLPPVMSLCAVAFAAPLEL